MSRPVAFPPGSWPIEMMASIAAAYCGEPSVDAFLAKAHDEELSPKARKLKSDIAKKRAEAKAA